MSTRDLDIALGYLFNQVSLLDTFTIGIIRHFETKVSGKTMAWGEGVIGFTDVIPIVEEWMALSASVR